MVQIGILLAGLLAGTGTGAAAADAEQQALKVFVTAAPLEAREEIDKATEKKLKKERDAAKQARKQLEKQLEKQHGKKREQWPPEADEQLYLAEEAEAMANAQYEYRKIKPDGLEDSAQDIIESAQGMGLAGVKERVRLVGSREEADLVVEVVGRRATKTLFTQIKPDRCYVLFTIGAGGALDSERFAALPPDWSGRKFALLAWRIQGPTAERPVFFFEAYNGGGNEFGCYGAAGNEASALVDKFVEDHHAALTVRVAAAESR